MMNQDRQEVLCRTDSIIGTNRILFQDVAAWNTRQNLDHYMVLVYLRKDPEKDITGYLHKAHRSPLRPFRCDLSSSPDKLYSELKTHIPNSPLRERLRRAWISDKTWESIDARITAHR